MDTGTQIAQTLIDAVTTWEKTCECDCAACRTLHNAMVAADWALLDQRMKAEKIAKAEATKEGA